MWLSFEVFPSTASWHSHGSLGEIGTWLWKNHWSNTIFWLVCRSLSLDVKGPVQVGRAEVGRQGEKLKLRPRIHLTEALTRASLQKQEKLVQVSGKNPHFFVIYIHIQTCAYEQGKQKTINSHPSKQATPTHIKYTLEREVEGLYGSWPGSRHHQQFSPWKVRRLWWELTTFEICSNNPR